MSAAGIGGVDADVAALPLADHEAAPRHHRLQDDAAPAVGVFEVELAALAGHRRQGCGAGRGAGRRRRGRPRCVELGPAADQADLKGAQRNRGWRAAQGLQQFAVFAAFLRIAGRVVGSHQAGELRQVDGRGIRQPSDDFTRQVALDLFGFELVHEFFEPLARLAGVAAMHVDRGQQEAVAFGDRQVQAHMAGDEMLEFVADGADQAGVGAQVFGLGQHCIGGVGLRAAARCRGRRAIRRRFTRRQIVARRQAVDTVCPLENP